MRTTLLLVAFAFLAGAQQPTKLSSSQVSYPPVQFAAIQVHTPTGILSVQLDPSIVLDMSGPFPVLKAVLPAPTAVATPRRTEVFIATDIPAATPAATVSLLPDGIREIRVYRNGLLMAPAIDYTVAAKVVTFVALQTPQPGDILQVSYGPI